MAMNAETIEALQGALTACFFIVWAVMGAAGFVAFYRGRDVGFKRRWFPWFVILGCALFLAFSSTLAALQARSWEGLRPLVFVGPGVLLVGFMAVRSTRFCGRCAAMAYGPTPFGLPKSCPKCGAPIEIPAKRSGHPDE